MDWKPGMWAMIVHMRDEKSSRVTITGEVKHGHVRVMNQRGERFTECVANLRKVGA